MFSKFVNMLAQKPAFGERARITEGGQLDFYFDLIFASKKDHTVNKKVA